MSDWQVGDLALCVSMPSGPVAAHWYPVVGCTYKVASVDHLIDGAIGIDLQEDPYPVPDACWDSRHFRKIKPDAEPCEEEFTVLIKRMKPAKVKS